MYFKEFPVVPYPFYIGDTRSYAIARNVLRRVAFSDRINSQSAFIEYDIKDGERPEHIANRVYGNANHHWIILLANNIIDPYQGWYKSQMAMEQYIQKKYSGTAVYFSGRGATYDFVYNTAFASGCTLSQNSNSQAITGYRETFCEFTVGSPVFTVGNAEVQLPSGSTTGIYIQKVLPSYQGLHHFAVARPTTGDGSNGSQENPFVDPLNKQSADYEDLGTVVGTQISPSVIGGATGATVAFWETYIGGYMGISGDEINAYAVSNYVYENDENESKRTIKVLAPAYMEQAIKELKNALGV